MQLSLGMRLAAGRLELRARAMPGLHPPPSPSPHPAAHCPLPTAHCPLPCSAPPPRTWYKLSQAGCMYALASTTSTMCRWSWFEGVLLLGTLVGTVPAGAAARGGEGQPRAQTRGAGGCKARGHHLPLSPCPSAPAGLGLAPAVGTGAGARGGSGPGVRAAGRDARRECTPGGTSTRGEPHDQACSSAAKPARSLRPAPLCPRRSKPVHEPLRMFALDKRSPW